MKVISETCGAH